jgi:hypothetical protein
MLNLISTWNAKFFVDVDEGVDAHGGKIFEAGPF